MAPGIFLSVHRLIASRLQEASGSLRGAGDPGARTLDVACPRPSFPEDHSVSLPIFIDLDGVLVESRHGARRDEFQLRPGVTDGFDRLRDVADPLVVLAEPPEQPLGTSRSAGDPVDFLRSALGEEGEQLLVASCPHESPQDPTDACHKPESGLVEVARDRYELPADGGWYIAGDKEGVQAGRQAGLRTIRVGPPDDDHRTAVHRADYEARDLMDAATRVMLEGLSLG